MIFIHVAQRKPLMAVCTIVGKSMKTIDKQHRFLNKCQPLKRLVSGFTLIELMVVMTVIALLISIAVPRYFHSVDHAKEASLKQTLNVMRVAIDKFYGDNDRYPTSITELVSKKYVRATPVDPITESAETWVIIAPSPDAAGAVFDIKSGATGAAKDGTAYADW